MSQPTLIKCKDGSHTLFSEKYNQHYHNPNGAVKESLHIFFNVNGLQEALVKGYDFSVLEVGFGTGLNLLLLADLHKSLGSSSIVEYYSIESELIKPEIVDDLNYHLFLKNPKLMELHSYFFNTSAGMNTFTVTEHIKLHLFNGLFEDFSVSSLRADFILHDAFSPGVNAELWSAEAFSKLKAHASEKATLSTYSSATKARKAMTEVGWLTTRVPGILGKREITVAKLK